MIPSSQIGLGIAIVAILIGAGSFGYTATTISGLEGKIDTIAGSTTSSANDISKLKSDIAKLEEGQAKSKADQELAAVEQQILLDANRLGVRTDDVRNFGADLIEAAQKEGKVTSYSIYGWKRANAEINSEFNARFGIEVENMAMGSEDIYQRYLGEQAAGKSIVDVLVSAQDSLELLSNNLRPLEKLIPDQTAQYKTDSPAKYGPEGRWISTLGRISSAIGYNTELVDPSEVPTTIEGLLDEKWKGKVLVPDSSVDIVGHILEYYPNGESWLKELAGNGAIALNSYSGVGALLAAGEGQLGFLVGADVYSRQMVKGAPVSFVPIDFAGNGIYISFNSISTVNDAPNPNAALLYVAFVLTDEGQDLIDKVGIYYGNNNGPIGFMKRYGITPPDLEIWSGDPEAGASPEDVDRIRTLYRDVFGIKPE